MVAFDKSRSADAKSRRSSGVEAGAALLVLALAFALPGPAAADEAAAERLQATTERAPAAMRAAPWLVVATQGPNRYRVVGGIPNVWQPLERGVRLKPGSVVESGAAGHIVLFNGHDTVTFAPNSRIALPRSATGANNTIIVQETGTAHYEVESWRLPSDLPGDLPGDLASGAGNAGLARDRANRRFEVRTPAFDTAAKSSAFNIRVVTESQSISVGSDEAATAEEPVVRGRPTGPGVQAAALTALADDGSRRPWFRSLL